MSEPDRSRELVRPEPRHLGAGPSPRGELDDVCPWWWPRRPWPPPVLGPDAPLDVLAADRAYVCLTLTAQASAWTDPRLAAEARRLAHGHLRDAVAVLAHGARLRWDDELCPPWPWRRPWPPRPDWLDRDHGRDPVTSNPMPGRAVALLDALAALSAYNLAARIDDAALRLALTSAIGAGLVAHLDVQPSTSP